MKHLPTLSILTIVLTLLAAFFLIGCQSQPKTSNSVLKTNKQSSAQQEKVSKAFEDSKALEASHSKWFDREEKLPLTIIATAYIDNEVIKTKEYKSYKILIKKIQKDITLLDKLSGKDISSKYSSIKFIDYNKDSNAIAKFHATYSNQHNDKDKLTDILRPDIETPSQELIIRLNLAELKKGNLTIEGYKTVKQSKLKRNSYYYTLRKTGYDKLNKKEKNQAIVNSLIATLQLSIPEYVSIDRKELVKKDELLRFVTPQEDGTYVGEVWKYSPDSKINELNSQIYNVKNSPYIKKLRLKRYKIKRDHLKIYDSIKIYKALNPWGDLKDWKRSVDSLQKPIKDSINLREVAIGGGFMITVTGYGKESTLNFYDTSKKKLLKTLKGHTDEVTSVAITSDGRYCLSGSKDKTIRYWNPHLGKTLKILKGHESPVDALAISPNENYALSGSYRTIKYWNLKTGKLIKTLKGHKGVTSLVFSKDGKYALSGGSDNKLRYWDLKTGKAMKVLKGHTDWVNDIALSSDAKYAVSASGDKTIRYWDLKTGKTIKVLKGHTKTVQAVKFSPDEKAIFSASDDYSIRYWKVKFTKKEKEEIASLTKKLKKEKTIQKKRLNLLREQLRIVNASKSYIEVTSTQHILTTPIEINDSNLLKEYKYISNLKSDIKTIEDIQKSLNYDYQDPILSLSFPSYAQKSDTNIIMNGKTIILKHQKNHNMNSLYFSSAVSLNSLGYTRKYKASIQSIKEEVTVLDGHDSTVHAVAFSPDGKYALSGGYDKTIIYWDLKSGEKIRTLEDTWYIFSLAISPDGRYALSGGSGQSIKYWDLKTGELIKSISGTEGEIVKLQISRDGTRAAIYSKDKQYECNLNDGVKDGELQYGKYFSYKKPSYIKSPDGNYALKFYLKKNIEYINLSTNKKIKILQGHETYIYSVAFSPDGNFVLSGSGDDTVRYWNLNLVKMNEEY